jgi:hypothetical protein
MQIDRRFSGFGLQVTSSGGAAPLRASVDVDPNGSDPGDVTLGWDGTLDPDSSVTLTFPALLRGIAQLHPF